MAGIVIFLDGPSSSGKSTLAAAVQARCELPLWHYSIDHLAAGGVLPRQRIDRGDFAWASMRQAFFEGFHRSIPAFAAAGNALVVEHIIEEPAWMDRLLGLLAPLDVFLVGLHCPLDELERRERQRGDRRAGEARADFERAFRCADHDLELDSRRPVDALADRLLAAWRGRAPDGALQRLRRAAGPGPALG